jgi:hypothetical protein
MKTLEMTRVSGIPRQILNKLLTPESILVIYTFVSWITRLSLNLYLTQIGSGSLTMSVTFPVSILVTIFFIWISYFKKIDWYGRKKTGPISRVIKFFSEKSKINTLLVILFFLDPYLFFIYFNNRHTSKLHFLTAWTLLLLSLFATSLAWMAFGFLIKFIF